MRLPLYASVERVVAGEILDGSLPVGARLPTEDQLIERFGVSRITVRRAVQNLAARGLVDVRWGRGTFVAPPRLTQPLTSLTGFVEDMASLGLTATARVLRVETIPADAGVAAELNVDTGTHVTHIERVRLGDGRPISLDDTYLPLDVGERVAGDDLTHRPVFELLEQKYDIPLIEATYRLSADKADAHTAAALKIDSGAPVFRIDRTSFTTGSRPVDHETLRYRGDAVRFETRLPRGDNR
ncbi:MAG TPA: GntR family transcriptional regulator [Pseudonocardiaceae bacterium]|nr:GntR family transcriptional regulator [Pseudonocardiaceae bacterium]